MEERKQIRTGFFWDASSVGLFVGFVIALIFFILMVLIDGWEKQSFNYKKALFHAAAGENLENLEDDRDLSDHPEKMPIIFAGLSDGFFLRQIYKKGTPFEEIVSKEVLVRKILKISGVKQFTQQDADFFKLPEGIHNLASSEYWQKIRDKDKVVLKGILEKGNKVPEMKYQEISDGFTLLVGLVVIQFCGFISFLTDCNKYMCCGIPLSCQWYGFDWKSFWIYPSLAVFMPGALPLVLLMTIVTFSSPSFWKRVGENIRSNSMVSSSSFNLNFSDDKDGKIVLERLKQRLKGKNNV